jgi:hypothetical protein
VSQIRPQSVSVWPTIGPLPGTELGESDVAADGRVETVAAAVGLALRDPHAASRTTTVIAAKSRLMGIMSAQPSRVVCIDAS